MTFRKTPTFLGGGFCFAKKSGMLGLLRSFSTYFCFFFVGLVVGVLPGVWLSVPEHGFV